MQSRSEELHALWNAFVSKLNKVPDINQKNLADIKRLMTSEAVVDLSLHEIYTHTAFIHDLTQRILRLKEKFPRDVNVDKCHQRWLDMLRKRNQQPLKTCIINVWIELMLARNDIDFIGYQHMGLMLNRREQDVKLQKRIPEIRRR